LGIKIKKEKALGLRDFLILFLGCGIIMTIVKAATVFLITLIMVNYPYIRLFGRLWDWGWDLGYWHWI
jgi:hypothetical protein